MPIALNYTHPEASNTSRWGVPLQLHAYGITGANFNRGNLIQLSPENVATIFTGVSLIVPNNTLGIITSFENPRMPRLSIAKGIQTLPPGFSGEIIVEVTSIGTTSLIEFGMPIANVYFVDLKT